MIVQMTFDGCPISVAPRKTARTYRFDGRSTSNIVDQISLLTNYRKSEFVEHAIRLAAILVSVAGPDALRSLSEITDEDLSILEGAIRTLIDTIYGGIADE